MTIQKHCAMGSSLVRLFAQKVWKEKKCHRFRNVFITVFALVFGFAVCNILPQRTNNSKDPSLDVTIGEDDLADYLPGELINKIFYTPRTPLTETLVELARNKLYIVDERIVPLNNETDLEYALLDSEHICFGIIFENVSETGSLRYIIRTKNNNFRTAETYSRDVFSIYRRRDDEYVESGFLALQNALDWAYVTHLSSTLPGGMEQRKFERVSLRYGHIPVDEGRGPGDPSSAYYIVSWYVTTAVVASTYLLLLPLVEERACGMGEHLKIACSASYWNQVMQFGISFLHFFLIFLASLPMTWYFSVWETNTAQQLYLIALLVLFLLNLIAFMFFLSSTLESSTVAMAVAPVSLVVPVLLGRISDTLAPSLCVFPVNGFYAGGSIFISYKSSGHLFGAADIFTAAYPSLDGMSLFRVYTLLTLGFIMWTLLWFYVSNVFPGRYGTAKSKGFFLSRHYWQGVRQGTLGHTNKIMAESQRELQPHGASTNEPPHSAADDCFEMELEDRVEERASGRQHAQPLVCVKKLNKIYKARWNSSRTKVAVKDFSLNIYSHNITVLLGHNGAGKTTTMNVITGMVPRTSGSIVVDGEHDPNRYRQRIGFCPQHNVFFSYLSCEEHLHFFGRLRGLSEAEARAEAQLVLQKVNLADKSKHYVHKLSGGMKRRLSLAIAIIGHTKLLILDEPTSGLDPETRRDIWDLLLKLRKDHTILLTTHFMEEADILGDWIAIMEYGEMVSFGTPLFLKEMYGMGYTLKLQKTPDFDSEQVMELVRQYVPKAVVREAVNEVFAVRLPYNASGAYPSLLSALERDQQALGIDAISMSNATLEEVFLNSNKASKAIQHHPESEDRVDSPIHIPVSLSDVGERPSKISPWLIHYLVWAIWQKKWIHIMCNKHIYSSLMSLPVIATALCFWTTTGHVDVAIALPTIALNARSIQHATVVIAINRDDGDGESKYAWLSKEKMLSENPSALGNVQLVVQENVSLDEVLQQSIAQDYTRYRDRVVAGIEFNASADNLAVTVLHNNNLLHSTGIGESVVTAILLRHLLSIPDPIVEVQNIPSTRKLLIDIGTPYYFTEMVPIAFMFCILVYLQVPLLEHQTGFRQLQNINRYVYWGSTYAFDLLTYIFICALVTSLAWYMDRKGAFPNSVYELIFLILLLYGMQALLVVYIISQCVNNSNTAITIMSYLGIIAVGGVFLLSSGYDDIRNNWFFIAILHLIPEFALKHSMRVVYENQKLAVYENRSNGHADYGDRRLTLVLCSVQVIALPVLVILLNEVVEDIYRREKISNVPTTLRRHYKEKVTLHRFSSREAGNTRREGDVELDGPSTHQKAHDEIDGPSMQYIRQESETVDKLLTENVEDERKKYAIVVKELQKQYSEHDAVKRISFAVKKGECFGLLGINGAGKTTVFQMLSGNLPISAGEVYLQHCEVQKTNALEYREQYGYCPQIDMLLDFMTVYETINYLAQLKRIPSREKHILHWLTVLDILPYKDHALSECSGGTKRKVNTILALLGGPSVVLLDEPTTGVDPKSRQFLWKCIKAIQRDDQTILLTSHSMDECEELCNRLSIMVDGRLRCIGSILQLKKRHSQGYVLLLKLNNQFDADGAGSSYSKLIADIRESLSARLLEEHKGMLKFAIEPSVKLSEVFGRMNELKHEYADTIVSYSISETSLEDVFLQFRSKTAQG